MPRLPAPPWFFPGQEVTEIATGIEWVIRTVYVEPYDAPEVTALVMDEDHNIATLRLSAFLVRFRYEGTDVGVDVDDQLDPMIDEDDESPVPYYAVFSESHGMGEPRIALVVVYHEGEDFRDILVVASPSGHEERIIDAAAPRHVFIELLETFSVQLGARFSRRFQTGDIFMHGSNIFAVTETAGENIHIATVPGFIPNPPLLETARHLGNGRAHTFGGTDPRTIEEAPTLRSARPRARRVQFPVFEELLVRRSAFERLTGDDEL